jgi:hypothetical protein
VLQFLVYNVIHVLEVEELFVAGHRELVIRVGSSLLERFEYKAFPSIVLPKDAESMMHLKVVTGVCSTTYYEMLGLIVTSGYNVT